MITFIVLGLFLTSYVSSRSLGEVNRRATGPAATCTAISPAPTKTVCGQYGTLNETSEFAADTNYQIVSSLSACADLVAPVDGSGYASFAYNTATGLCTFYNTYPGEDGSTFTSNPNGNNIYYQNTCFKCSFGCPLTASGNLLGDPGFESSSQYYGPWLTYGFDANFTETIYPNTIKIVSPGSNSSNSLNMQPSGVASKLLQYFPYCTNTLYSYTMDYKVTTPGTTGSSFFVILPDNSAEYLQITSTNGAFLTYRDYYYFTNNSYDSEYNYLNILTEAYSGTQPNVFLDNFGISAVYPGPPQAVSGSSSLVPNGNFQSGALAPWKYTDDSGSSDSYAIVSPGLNGSKYKFQFTAATSMDSFTLAQTLSLTKGTGYTFSVSFAGSLYSATIYIGERYFFYQPASLPLSGTATYVNAFVAQSSSVSLNLTIVEESLSTGPNVYVDNIIIQPLST